MAKHEKSFVNYDKPYETNLIGLRGVIYFAVGLVVLIVTTFGLMYFLQNVMENQAVETKDTRNPMMVGAGERLPPEPRLQAAPGFGVESENGRVNLELSAPQSEYRVLKSQWEKLWAEGQRDEKTGMVVTMPIEEAVKKLIEQNADSGVNAEEGQKLVDQSRSIVSYSSAGRTATDKRR
ncbi:MAG TPA: hypothetical protein VNI84_21730 [Pyrinomonadaceae bacterium]|nr:hypothetical protein [Pyrinomonadaceae bacterium]